LWLLPLAAASLKGGLLPSQELLPSALLILLGLGESCGVMVLAVALQGLYRWLATRWPRAVRNNALGSVDQHLMKQQLSSPWCLLVCVEAAVVICCDAWLVCAAGPTTD
jgi:hypothetical protein